MFYWVGNMGHTSTSQDKQARIQVLFTFSLSQVIGRNLTVRIRGGIVWLSSSWHEVPSNGCPKVNILQAPLRSGELGFLCTKPAKLIGTLLSLSLEFGLRFIAKIIRETTVAHNGGDAVPI